MWELNFELVHVESELSQHCRHREIMLYKPANWVFEPALLMLHQYTGTCKVNMTSQWQLRNNWCLQSEVSFPLLITTLWLRSCGAHLVNTIIPTWLEAQHVSWQGRSVSNQAHAGYLLHCINHLLAWAQNSQWTHGWRAVDRSMWGTWSALCWKLAIPSCCTTQCPSAELNTRGEGYSRIVCLDWSETPLFQF